MSLIGCWIESEALDASVCKKSVALDDDVDKDSKALDDLLFLEWEDNDSDEWSFLE